MTTLPTWVGFDFVANIWIYERDDETFQDYEARAPGYGYSCAYFIPEITSRTMTAYIYDRGRSDIPDGIDNDIVRGEFDQSTFEAFSNSALYFDVEMTEDGVCGFDACPKFLYATATFTDVDVDEPRASLVAVTRGGASSSRSASPGRPAAMPSTK
ncbi:MAG: hypothetical protein IKE66_06025 [Hyphomicrobium sp.]|nr:hypothetical protein [Hyphomicrobium sp.]